MLPCIAPFGAVLSISVITDLLCLLFIRQFPASSIHFRRAIRAHAEQTISIRKTQQSRCPSASGELLIQVSQACRCIIPLVGFSMHHCLCCDFFPIFPYHLIMVRFSEYPEISCIVRKQDRISDNTVSGEITAECLAGCIRPLYSARIRPHPASSCQT